MSNLIYIKTPNILILIMWIRQLELGIWFKHDAINRFDNIIIYLVFN